MAMFHAASGSPFRVGNNPVSIATADVNGDGNLDLLTTNYISDNVTLLLGDGRGGFSIETGVAFCCSSSSCLILKSSNARDENGR